MFSMKFILTKFHNPRILILMFFLVLYSVTAQNRQKKIYTSNLDSLWSRSVYINKMTIDGNWLAFTEVFDHKENVLFLKHTTDATTFKFTESDWIMFSGNNRWFGCITSGKELNIISLEKRTKQIYQDIESYSFSKSGDYIAAFQKNTETTGTILIIDLNSKAVSFIQDVKKYVWHPEQNSLLVTIYKENKDKVALYNVKDLSHKVIIENQNSSYNYLIWSDLGNALVLSEQFNQENYLHYHSLNGKLKTLDNVTIKAQFPQYKISNRSVYISRDGKKILFYRQSKKEGIGNNKATMEVWNTEDPWIYPKMKEYEERELQYLLTAWYPETNKLIAIETEDIPTAALDVNHDYAMVFDKLQYEPLYKEFPNTDIYVKNMQSGAKQLVIQNQYTEPGFVTISPYGKYIAYFKNKHWWVYDTNKDKTVNLTENLKVSFEDFESDHAGDAAPFGNPGWSLHDEFIILYDQYDIWLLSPDGNYKERVTKGREEKIKYRISKDYRRNDYYFLTVNVNFSSSPFKPDKGVILEMRDDSHKTGYAIWNKGNKIRKVIFEDRKMDVILISEDFRNIVFRKQKFNEPPVIYRLNTEKNREYLIHQSNKDLLDYDLGRSQFIKYNMGEKMLSGTLLYPANFNPKKKYPMIVCIYEKASGGVNFFEPPSNYGYIGFNALKYLTNDYFVLYPDISFTIGEPGMSALSCVTLAVNKALESGFIDNKKIGLIGHSFGGYESAFIATQTDMFATIVASASVIDFTSHYHSVGWNWKQPEMWRYESQQWRMGDSYYNIKDAYFRNSPIHHVENVRTPLLLWTGKEDYQVHWEQSIEMFLALKRLNKKCKLLLFEKESHALINKDNQKRLSTEIMDWFDKYCKNKNE